MIKAVLFDFDGVLTLDKNGSGPTLRYIAQTTGIPLEQLEKHYYPYNDDLLDGKITHQDMWDSFCKKVGENIDISILTDAYQHTSLDNQMLGWVKELGHKYKIAMVTDNKCDRMDEIFSFYNVKELFDVISVSAKLHASKKEQEIFRQTLSKLGLEPKECVFIDNSPGNLIVPKQMGIHTILFDDKERNIEEIKETVARINEKQSH